MEQLRYGGIYVLPEGQDELDEEDGICVEFVCDDESELTIAFVYATESEDDKGEDALISLENGEEMERVSSTSQEDRERQEVTYSRKVSGFASANGLVCMAAPAWYRVV